MLLADAGREVIGDRPPRARPRLPNHTTQRPTPTSASRVFEASDEHVGPDSTGRRRRFLAGCDHVVAAAAVNQPRSDFGRIVLAGIGENVFKRDEAGCTQRIVEAIENQSDTSESDASNRARLFAQYAHQPGNDPVALAAIMKRPRRALLTPDDLAAITCPVLVAVGDRDFVLPAEPLVDALPDARLATLRRTDHFATPESFDFIDAALEFLDAVPG